MSDIYKANIGSDDKWYVDGPGDGLGYYSGTLNPGLRCETEAEAKRAALIANIAYKAGYAKRGADIRETLAL